MGSVRRALLVALVVTATACSEAVGAMSPPNSAPAPVPTPTPTPTPSPTPSPTADPSAPVGARPLVGINNGTGYRTDPAYVDQAITWTQDLGLGIARVGMDGIGCRRAGQACQFASRDATIAAYRAAGIKVHSPISMRGHVDAGRSTREWLANWETQLRQVFAHYKGKISYYIIDNEPDVRYGSDQLARMDPALVVEFNRVAARILDEVDPAAVCETSPPSNPRADGYVQELLDAGIADTCEVVGVHAYGGQVEDGILNGVWRDMEERGIRKPVAISEAGAIDSYSPDTGAEGRRRWFNQFAVQVKRYGFDNVLLFDIDAHDEWALLGTPAYSEVRRSYVDQAFTNGDFEAAGEDGEFPWNRYDPKGTGEDLGVAFVDQGGRSGPGAVALDAAQGARVRQIAGRLVPGTTYTVTASVRVPEGATARLAAQGFDHTDGDRELEAVAGAGGDWQTLTAKVTPSNPFLVVDLSVTGTGRVLIDDVAVTPSG